MKYLIYIFILLAVGLLIYNATLLNFDDVFSGTSKTAVIGVLASACVIVLMVILLLSKTIQKKSNY